MNTKKVTTWREAHYAECRECGHIIERGPYWGLSTVAYLHSSGTGHKGVTRYAYVARP